MKSVRQRAFACRGLHCPGGPMQPGCLVPVP